MRTLVAFLPVIFVSAGLLGTPADAATYRHSSGLSFVYPDSWQIVDGEYFYLVPPGVEKNWEGTPKEMLVIDATSTGDLTDPLDPAITQYFDETMFEVFPMSRRQGDAQLSGHGAYLDYSAGDGKTHRVHYRIFRGLGVSMTHVGRGDEKHAQVVDEIFASLDGELQSDSAIVGAWSTESSSMSGVDYDMTGGGSSYVSASSWATYTFFEDRRFTYHSGASVSGQTAGLGTLAQSSGDNEVDGGTYLADGENLTILWDEGGVTERTYSLFETNDGIPAMKLVNPETGDHKFYKRSN